MVIVLRYTRNKKQKKKQRKTLYKYDIMFVESFAAFLVIIIIKQTGSFYFLKHKKNIFLYIYIRDGECYCYLA